MMTAALALLALLAAPARASGDLCVQCCKDRGLVSCPTKIRVFGDGSLATREGQAWRVIGVWWLDCAEGASFEEGRTVVLDHAPAPGEIIRLASPPATVSCFRDHCALPAGSCVREGAGQTFFIERCNDGRPLTASELRVKGHDPDPPVQQVRIGNRTILATPVGGPTDGGASGDPQVAVVIRDTQAMSPTITTPAPAPAPPEDVGDVTIDLPGPPGGDCTTSDALQAESRRHVDLGDEARVAGRYQEAADEYRAALSMDRCDAFAWASLGEIALKARRSDDAVRALRVATRLQPGHYGAWTALGLAYEAQGRNALAVEAFESALDIQADHEPAREGLWRARRAE